MYNIKTKQVKNSLIPSLSNDYYSKQLILTNNYQNELSELPFLENTKNNIANETDNQKIYDIPLILQNPKYPNGCEAAAAVMLLNYYGIDINLDEFINLLPKSPIYEENGTRFGPNPAKYYAGDPSSPTKGWGCFDTVIANTINTILASNNSFLISTPSNVKNDLETISHSSPCLIWVTINYEEASDVFTWSSYDKLETYTYPKNEHVVVLTGYDNNNYYINDPLNEEKNLKIPKRTLEKSFDSLGRQYVTITIK